ncbi:MAG: hypothetical protein WBR15_07900 [Gammaproteobacteria bacterium]
MEQRSAFVTVVAWIFIVFSGLGILESVTLMFVPWQAFMTQAQTQSAQMPHDMQLLGAQIMHIFSLIWLIIGLWVFASSIGLLMRKNWARISYIVMMALGIGASAIYLLLGILMLVMFHSAEFRNNPAFQHGMPSIAFAFMVIWIIFAAAFMALYIWILIKLTSAAVCREFLQPSTGLQA